MEAPFGSWASKRFALVPDRKYKSSNSQSSVAGHGLKMRGSSSLQIEAAQVAK
jgi:hypothetical protein